MAECQAAEVDIDAIIREVMSENKISPSEIPEEKPFELSRFIKSFRRRKKWSKRYFKGHARGEFKCAEATCGNTWTSPYSWCVLDLKKQAIIRKFKQ